MISGYKQWFLQNSSPTPQKHYVIGKDTQTLQAVVNIMYRFSEYVSVLFQVFKVKSCYHTSNCWVQRNYHRSLCLAPLHYDTLLELYQILIENISVESFLLSLVSEMRGDNWQEVMQRYITAPAGGLVRSLCSWKLSSYVYKLPPNPPLPNLAVILSFLPSLSSSLSGFFSPAATSLFLPPFFLTLRVSKASWEGGARGEVD